MATRVVSAVVAMATTVCLLYLVLRQVLVSARRRKLRSRRAAGSAGRDLEPSGAGCAPRLYQLRQRRGASRVRRRSRQPPLPIGLGRAVPGCRALLRLSSAGRVARCGRCRGADGARRHPVPEPHGALVLSRTGHRAGWRARDDIRESCQDGTATPGRGTPHRYDNPVSSADWDSWSVSERSRSSSGKRASAATTDRTLFSAGPWRQPWR